MAAGFGDMLYGLLRERGVSMRQFAKEVGVAAPSISLMKKGRRPVPWDQAVYWADHLNLSKVERIRFLDLAALTQSPERIRQLVSQAEAAYGGTLRDLINSEKAK